MSHEEKQLDAIKKLLEDHISTHENDVKAINDKLDIIYPVVKKDMENAAFWLGFQDRFRMGGNTILWTVGLIAGVVILTGYGKAVVLTWLGLGK